METEDFVFRVIAMDRHRVGLPVILTDGDFVSTPAVWSAARRVGSSSDRLVRTLAVREPSTTDIVEDDNVVLLLLPKDLRVGDQIAMPSRRAVTVSSRAQRGAASGRVPTRAAPRG